MMKYNLPKSTILIPLLSIFIFFSIVSIVNVTKVNAIASTIHNVPYINDPDLTTKVVFTGLKFPITMAFLNPNDILVLEKDEGTVNRIVNGTMLPEPILKVPVANDGERGMIGIAISKHEDGHTYVFLYYTESGGGKTGDDVTQGIQPLGNRLYKYELVDNKLKNPKLLLNLPATSIRPSNDHVGGKLLIGPDENVYLIVGNIGGHETITQNFHPWKCNI